MMYHIVPNRCTMRKCTGLGVFASFPWVRRVVKGTWTHKLCLLCMSHICNSTPSSSRIGFSTSTKLSIAHSTHDKNTWFKNVLFQTVIISIISELLKRQSVHKQDYILDFAVCPRHHWTFIFAFSMLSLLKISFWEWVYFCRRGAVRFYWEQYGNHHIH